MLLIGETKVPHLTSSHDSTPVMLGSLCKCISRKGKSVNSLAEIIHSDHHEGVGLLLFDESRKEYMEHPGEPSVKFWHVPANQEYKRTYAVAIAQEVHGIA